VFYTPQTHIIQVSVYSLGNYSIGASITDKKAKKYLKMEIHVHVLVLISLTIKSYYHSRNIPVQSHYPINGLTFLM